MRLIRSDKQSEWRGRLGLYAQTTIALPAQPLGTAITELARESGTNILVPADLVGGREAPALTGKFEVGDALTRMLVGTGLEAVRQDAKTWVIQSAPKFALKPAAGGVEVLPTIQVAASSAQPQSEGFVASATRTDTPISEIPQTIQIVTQDVMKSQQINSVQDALQNFSSVTTGGVNVSGTRRGYVLLPQPEAAPRQSKVYSLGLPFVDEPFGRSSAVSDLLRLSESSQIVTLTGAGGIGKTSLAIKACRDTGDLFLCIRYISLALIQNDREAREAILSIFSDVVNGSAMSVEEMSRSLRESQCLVILDNCEHLIESAAWIAQTITAGNPGVRVLATSREALRIAAETIYPVQTLALPSQASERDTTLRSDAVKLFQHRLQRLSTNLGLNDRTILIIGEICRRLDGIPLAIEFAAARAATLGLDAVRAHLDDRFAILTGGSRDALPRHQTLRAVFEWSYRLLSETEQLLFRQASVFADGMSLEAIAAIMA